MGTGKPLGYAFTNFVDTDIATRFIEEFPSFEWGVEGDVTPEAAWSTGQQGLVAHVERFRNSPVMHESVPETMRPAIFKAGLRQQFPPPTASVKAPRVRPLPKDVTEALE